MAVAKRQTSRPPAARPPSTGDLDSHIRQILADIRLLEGSARVLQSRLDIVTAALSETLTAISTLEGTKGKAADTETLVPIGSGSFFKTKLTDVEKVIIGVGAGICIEKPLDDSMKDLRLRSSELERARTTVTQQLTQIVSQAEEARAQLNDLARKRGGGTVEIV